MKIYLDFDGTVVEHAYPKIGRLVPMAMEVITQLLKKGHDIILNTYRVECNDNTLSKAMEFINYHPRYEIVINDHTREKIYPDNFDIDSYITNGVIFIDDQSYGVPLIPCVMMSGNMVDWKTLQGLFKEKNIL